VISRRTFLAGSAASALLAACGGDGGGTTTTTPTSTTEAPLVPDRLAAGFADGYSSDVAAVVAGIPQRAPFVVVNALGQPLRGEDAPASVDVEIVHDGATITGFTVARHAEGIITPYYPVVFTPPEPGDYEMRSDLSGSPTPFLVGTRDQLGIVQVGDKLRPVETPTTADARGVDPICTRPQGTCPFHTATLTEALAAGTPVLFVISTPGFCQTEICGPVLEMVVEAAPRLSGVSVVHAEVYTDPRSGSLEDTTEAISTYALAWEPSLYVADATGTVTARLDFLWDVAEFDAAVATVA
jgi:hypothetical protein